MAREIPGPQVENFTVPIPLVLTRESVADALGPYTVPEYLPPLEECAFKGKNVLVTGSGRGIGRATALRFAEFGANVAVNSRSSSWEQGISTVDEINAMGRQAIYLPGDVASAEDVAGMFSQVKKDFGGIDIVVNNAGIRVDDLIMRLSEKDLQGVFDTNLQGEFNVLKQALKLMGKNRGRFIDVSSVAALGSPGQTPYASTKAGGEILGISAGIEMAKFNRPFDLGIFRIALTDTDLVADLTPEQRGTLVELFPSRKIFTPEEAAVGITYLASLPQDENAHRLTFA